jgi:hypothetical protein
MGRGDGCAHSFIIAGLVPAILFAAVEEDARDKPGHDGLGGLVFVKETGS